MENMIRKWGTLYHVFLWLFPFQKEKISSHNERNDLRWYNWTSTPSIKTLLILQGKLEIATFRMATELILPHKNIHSKTPDFPIFLKKLGFHIFMSPLWIFQCWFLLYFHHAGNILFYFTSLHTLEVKEHAYVTSALPSMHFHGVMGPQYCQ